MLEESTTKGGGGCGELKPYTICTVIAREERSHRPVLTLPTSQAPAALHKQYLLAGRP
jgi:hypothetical protein